MKNMMQKVFSNTSNNKVKLKHIELEGEPNIFWKQWHWRTECDFSTAEFKDTCKEFVKNDGIYDRFFLRFARHTCFFNNLTHQMDNNVNI